jgi:hypothetical protein
MIAETKFQAFTEHNTLHIFTSTLKINVEAILNTPNAAQILEKLKELNQNISAHLPSEFHKI